MCELCSMTPKDKSVACEYRARDLERLAAFFRAIGSGRINLHSQDIKDHGLLISNIIRDLVGDWM